MSILSIGELLDLGNSASTAGLVPYSALEYNASGDISGISGSAIAGGVDTTIVSSIASSYVESGVSSKVDQSAFDECCSAMSAVVSGKLDASASSQFQQSGDYADASSLSSKLDASASSEFYPMTGNPSGFLTGVDLTDYATTAYVDSSVSGKLDASASGQFQLSGDYYSASNPSGFIGSDDLSGYVPYSATLVPIGSANTANGEGFAQLLQGFRNSGKEYAVAQGNGNTACNSLTQGYSNLGSSNSLAIGYMNTAKANGLSLGYKNSADNGSLAQGSTNKAMSGSFAQGFDNKASYRSFTHGSGNSAEYDGFAHGFANSAGSFGVAMGNQNTAMNDALAVGGANNSDLYSLAAGSYCSASSWAVSLGSCVSSKNVCTVIGKNNLSGDGTDTSGAAFVIGDGTASSDRHDLLVITKDGEVTVFSGTSDTAGTGILSSIRALSAGQTGSPENGWVQHVTTANYSASSDNSHRGWVAQYRYPQNANAICVERDTLIAPSNIQLSSYESSTGNIAQTASAIAVLAPSSVEFRVSSRSETSHLYTSREITIDPDLSGSTSIYSGDTVYKYGNFVLNPTCVSGGNYSSNWKLGSAEYNYWNSKLDGSAYDDFVLKSTTELEIGSGNSANVTSVTLGTNNTATSGSFAAGWNNVSYTGSFVAGVWNTAQSGGVAVGDNCSAVHKSVAMGFNATAKDYSFAQGNSVYASGVSFAQGSGAKATNKSFAQGAEVTATNSSMTQGFRLIATNGLTAFGKANKTTNGANAAFVIGDGNTNDYSMTAHDLLVVSRNGEITTYSSTADNVGYKLVSTLQQLSAWATANGWTGAT